MLIFTEHPFTKWVLTKSHVQVTGAVLPALRRLLYPVAASLDTARGVNEVALTLLPLGSLLQKPPLLSVRVPGPEELESSPMLVQRTSPRARQVKKSLDGQVLELTLTRVSGILKGLAYSCVPALCGIFPSLGLPRDNR